MSIITRAHRNVTRKKARTLLVIFALGLSVATIISVNTGIDASKANTQDMIASYESTLIDMGNMTDMQLRQIIVQNLSSMGGKVGGGGNGGGMGGGDAPVGFMTRGGMISTDVIDDIESIHNETFGYSVDKAIPSLSAMYRGEDSESRKPDFTINGVVLDKDVVNDYNVLPSEIVKGRGIREDDSPYGMTSLMIHENMADYFDADVGDTVTLDGIEFTVVGLFSSSTEDNTVYTSLSNLQKVLGYESDEINRLDVYVEDRSMVEDVVYEIEAMYPDFRAQSLEEYTGRTADMMESRTESQIVQLEEDMEKIESTGTQVIFISGITAALIVMFLMFYTVRERLKEIGTMKALGFTRGKIVSQFVLEGTLIGVLGGVIGIGISWVATPFIADYLLPATSAYSISTTPGLDMIMLALGLTAFLGAAGSIYPAWSESRKNPAEAIQSE